MWAAGMIATGQLEDRIGRKPPVVAGMLTQAAGLAVITAASDLLAWAFMTETHPRHAGASLHP